MSENENKSIDPKLAEALKGVRDSLTDEQREKAKDCKTMDELIKLAGKEGIELPDEALDMVSGGCDEGSDAPPEGSDSSTEQPQGGRPKIDHPMVSSYADYIGFY
ncbi:MAG: hypothetical protein IJU66_06455 [Oscillospiraceae bacterium]|nr:hypothetical protein [Oscillospiraceae bacterium]